MEKSCFINLGSAKFILNIHGIDQGAFYDLCALCNHKYAFTI